MHVEARKVVMMKEFACGSVQRAVVLTGTRDSGGNRLMGLSEIVLLYPDPQDLNRFNLCRMPANDVEYGGGRLKMYAEGLFRRWPGAVAFERCGIRNGDNGPAAVQIQTNEYLCFEKEGIPLTSSTPFPITHIFVCDT